MAKVHHSAICTTDIAASLTFWRDGLGLTEQMDSRYSGDWPTLWGGTSPALRSVFLGDPAGLVGPGINQRLGAILQLPGAPGCQDHIAEIAVESTLGHLASSQKFAAGRQACVACISSRPKEDSTGSRRPVMLACRH